MPSTYSNLIYHIVFATKSRAPLIEAEWMDRLHRYLAGTVTAMEGKALEVGGISDHVHLLAVLRPSHCLADFVRDLKKESSKFVHRDLSRPTFAWQVGYGAFTEGEVRVAGLRHYIQNQAIHHRTESSQDELLRLCCEAGVEVDMRFFE
jgi:REP element-mobilizing transposase RayT